MLRKEAEAKTVYTDAERVLSKKLELLDYIKEGKPELVFVINEVGR